MKKLLLCFIPSFVFCLGFSSLANADQYRVVFDISRDVKRAYIYKNDQLLNDYRISGAKNRSHSVKGTRMCAFTTTGINIKPTHLYRNRYSNEHDINLPHFVTYDHGRGIGGHAGDTSGYSSGCIRQNSVGARYLYDLVREVSVISGSRIVSTPITFDVIDNTPGRFEAEYDCLTNYIRNKNYIGYQTRLQQVVCRMNGGSEAACTPAIMVSPLPLERSLRPRPRPDLGIVAQPEEAPAVSASEFAPTASLRPQTRPHVQVADAYIESGDAVLEDMNDLIESLIEEAITPVDASIIKIKN